MRVLLAAVLATAALVSAQLHTGDRSGGLSGGDRSGGLDQNGNKPFRGVEVYRKPSVKKSDPTMYSIPDCEDLEVGDGRACTQPDDGSPTGWMFVTSYHPYNGVPVVRCGQEDGGPVLPCVWTKHRNKQDGFNYFVK